MKYKKKRKKEVMIKSKVFQVRSNISSLTTAFASQEQVVSEAITKSLGKGKVPIEILQSSAAIKNQIGASSINTHITIFYKDDRKRHQPQLKCQIFTIKGNVSSNTVVQLTSSHEITEFLNDGKQIEKVIQSSASVVLPLGGSAIATHLTIFYYDAEI